MDEPTDNQLKILRDDIISGRVMIVEVEHYKTLTDNLSKSYDANKEQAGRVEKLEAENKLLRRPLEAANFKVDGMLAVGNELIQQTKRIKELEDKRFTNADLKCPFPTDFKDVCDLAKAGDATCKHTNKFTDLIYEQAERIQGFEAGVIQLVTDCNNAQIEAKQKIRKLKAKNDKLRGFLQDTLPHIECTNNSQSSLITEIGEYLQALEGGK